ncbi:DUF6510 family protein [Agromyces seonyuensis]|uniref:Uncharacterized protein n=1 Tax=Agromyces seonyuensis TaxID=2662446 RepID=A0A6I4P7H6_9MICO|nr:DUF6510 family protein [Agromyces seonyuensis]MWB99727.1 hypothetical protein [Agromyces seonyuensis]
MDERLDGNVLAGMLGELFDFDATTAKGRCRHCGDEAVLAEAHVIAHDGEFVARCRKCDAELLVAMEHHDDVVVSFRGLRGLGIHPAY